jgi:hypothetical protein
MRHLAPLLSKSPNVLPILPVVAKAGKCRIKLCMVSIIDSDIPRNAMPLPLVYVLGAKGNAMGPRPHAALPQVLLTVRDQSYGGAASQSILKTPLQNRIATMRLKSATRAGKMIHAMPKNPGARGIGKISVGFPLHEGRRADGKRLALTPSSVIGKCTRNI